MIRIWIIVLLFFPTGVWAEKTPVASGEHDTFVRLVFTISDPRVWELESKTRSAELSFPAQMIDFDLSETFTRISRSRLEKITTFKRGETTVFSMTLNCACEVQAFNYLDEYIVVDIKDKEIAENPQLRARHSAPDLQAVSAAGFEPNPLEHISWITPRPPSFVDSPYTANFPPEQSAVGIKPEPYLDVLPVISGTDQTAPDTMDEDLEEAVNTARESLLRQLTLAADQGLLELPTQKPIEETMQEPAPAEVTFVTPESVSLTDNQVSIQTIYQRDALASGQTSLDPSANCATDTALDIASWGSGDDFFSEVSALRSDLTREFDKSDLSVVRALIQAYLRYGFGAEARSYIMQHQAKLEDAEILSDISFAIESAPISKDGPMYGGANCPGAAGLWAMVGAYPDLPGGPKHGDSIVETFTDLPPDLRRLLGPRLAASFLDRGFPEVARKVSDILERAPGEHGDAHELVVGEIVHAEGGDATEIFRALNNGGSDLAARALIALANEQLASDEPEPDGFLLDISAGARVWRGSTNGDELKILEARLTAKYKSGSEALAILSAAMSGAPEDQSAFRSAIEQILGEMSSEDQLEDGFAATITTYMPMISENSVSDDLRIGIAEQLNNSALPDLARVVLQPTVERNNADALILAARAELLAFRPKNALTLLEHVKDERADLLKVEANLRLGHFSESLRLITNLDSQLEQNIEPYWYDGDWREAAKSDLSAATIYDRYLVPAARENASSPAPSSLSELQELLSSSQVENQELREILARR